MKTRIRSRATALVAALPLLVLAAACSAPSSPSPEMLNVSSQGISCTSDGIHFESCGTGGPTSPGKRMTCEVDSVCNSTPVDGFSAPTYPVGRECGIDQSFANQLVALGCVTPLDYNTGASFVSDAGTLVASNDFSIAWCPQAPVDSVAAWAVLDACNTCTGPQPQAGWVLVAWTNGACLTGTQPNGGCHSANCLGLN